MGEVHTQHAVTHFQDAHVRGHVGLSTRVGLNVHMFSTREKREGALLGKALDLVDELAAAVVAPPRQALGVLVGEPRALRLEHRSEGVVFARDQLDVPALAVALALHGRPQVGINLCQRRPGDAVRCGNAHGPAV